jgi:hypothetical protein
VPQPQSGPRYGFAALLQGGAGWVKVHVYSSAYRRLTSAKVEGPFSAGWVQLQAELPDLPPGIYFVVLEAGRDAEGKRGPPLRLVVLR